MININSKSKVLAWMLRLLYRKRIRTFSYTFTVEVMDSELLAQAFARQYVDELRDDVADFIRVIEKEHKL
jgi:hypothetical protein